MCSALGAPSFATEFDVDELASSSAKPLKAVENAEEEFREFNYFFSEDRSDISFQYHIGDGELEVNLTLHWRL